MGLKISLTFGSIIEQSKLYTMVLAVIPENIFPRFFGPRNFASKLKNTLKSDFLKGHKIAINAFFCIGQSANVLFLS